MLLSPLLVRREYARRGPIIPSREFPVAVAGRDVVVDHAYRLHEGIADSRADEAEAAALEVLAERVGLGGARRDLAFSRVLQGLATDELPYVAVEGAEFLLHGEKRTRVRHGAIDLQPVAHDAL